MPENTIYLHKTIYGWYMQRNSSDRYNTSKSIKTGFTIYASGNVVERAIKHTYPDHTIYVINDKTILEED